MERTQKKNTIGFEFGKDSVMPTLKEAISFLVKDMKIQDTEVHSVYLDLSDKTFFVKFIDDTALKDVTQRLMTTETFKYLDGTEAQVHVAVADGFFRYVRLFNLPPEVTDGDIAKALAKFGTVRQLVREKLPLELGFNAFSGTRGAHMDVKTEIPPALYIGHYKCRIFYEGLRNRCFVCKEEGHVKADCPKRPAAPRVPSDEQQPGPSVKGNLQYSAVAKGLVIPSSDQNGGRKVPNGNVKKTDEKPPEDNDNVEMDESEVNSQIDISPTRVVDKGDRSVSPDQPGKGKGTSARGRPLERRARTDGKSTLANVLQNLEHRSRSRSTKVKTQPQS